MRQVQGRVVVGGGLSNLRKARQKGKLDAPLLDRIVLAISGLQMLDGP